MGEKRGFRAYFQAVEQRSRQRIHDDRCHHRPCSSTQRRCAKKNGPQAIGRSRGGLTTKVHALVDALGNPVNLMLTPGQDHDLACAQPLLENADPGALLADKAYDAELIGSLLPVAPQVGWRDDKSAATQACASSQESTRKNDRDFIDVLLVLVDLPEFATKVSIINFDLCSTTLAGEVRMVAQPADSLLVLMATAKARKANTGLLKEAGRSTKTRRTSIKSRSFFLVDS